MPSKKPAAETFMNAFMALSPKEQRAVLSKLLKMRKLRRDLIDIAIAESRNREKSRPFKSFLAEFRE